MTTARNMTDADHRQILSYFQQQDIAIAAALNRTMTPGPPGADGSVIRNGTTAPSNGLGKDGDYYILLPVGDLYFKSSGTYSVVGNVRGPDRPVFVASWWPKSGGFVLQGRETIGPISNEMSPWVIGNPNGNLNSPLPAGDYSYLLLPMQVPTGADYYYAGFDSTTDFSSWTSFDPVARYVTSADTAGQLITIDFTLATPKYLRMSMGSSANMAKVCFLSLVKR